MASKYRFSLPKTEVACGSVTIRKDELTLTLHCMFCELAYENIELLRSHLLHAHVVEIVGTKELPKDAQILSEEKIWSKTIDMHCSREESFEVDQGREFFDEDFDFMDDEVSQDNISEIAISEELLGSYTELPGEMILNKENVNENAENKHLHLNTSAPSNTKIPERDLNDLQTIRFIELLKEEVCLWDTKFIYDCYHEVGNNAIKKLGQKLKEEFQLELDVNSKFVRAKIRQLKSIFKSGSKSKSFSSHLSFLEGHVPSKPSWCVICGEEVEDDFQQAHEKEHISDKTGGKCRLCNVHLPSKQYVVPHMTTHGIYICLHCNRDDFTTKRSYRDHVAEVHSKKTPPEDVVKPNPIFFCEYCGDAANIGFPTKSELHKHIVATHPKLRSKCSICKAPFKNKEEVLIHIRSAHRPALGLPLAEPPTAESLDEPIEYECEFCYHVPFLSQTDLKLHIKVEHYDLPFLVVSLPKELPNCYDCKMCEMSFGTQHILKAHMERQHDAYTNDRSNSCVCEYCGKIFELHRSLRRHRKLVHTRLGYYKCDVCDCGYSSQTRLRLHVNSVHRKEPTHVCDICSAGFYAKRYLNQHKVQRHKVKRPFKCKQCDSEFFAKHALRRHEKEYHNTKE